MESVNAVEGNSGDGLSPVAASGFDEESTNLFPSLNELSQSYVLDTSLSGDVRTAPSKSISEEKRTRRVALVPKGQIPKEKNKYYERKIKHLKRLARELVYTNAALLDELSSYELEITKAKQERKSLLKRLFQFLPMTESQALQSSQALKSLAQTFHGNIPPSILGPLPTPTLVPPASQGQQSKKRPVKMATKRSKGSASKEK